MSEIYHGGGLDAAITKYGGVRSDWLDLSTGINPNAYPVSDLSDEVWQRLPDRQAKQDLLNAARNYYQVSNYNRIVAAPGTQAIIEHLPSVLNAKHVDILAPTYEEHAHSWKKFGSSVNLISHLDGLSNVDVLIVVNPNNPTAEVHAQEVLFDAARKVSFVIVDEAFCDPKPAYSIAPTLPENVIVLKSFGKFFGLAGLRLGFAVCNPAIAEVLEPRFGPWAVSGPALELGKRALRDKIWISETKARLENRSNHLAGMLNHYGLIVEGINPLFVYVKHENAQGIFEHLAQNQILVRPFPERPNYLRFGLCKDENELVRLQTAIEAYG